MSNWTTEEEIKLIEKLSAEHVVATPEDVCTILRKLDDPNDPDQEFFKEKISA